MKIALIVMLYLAMATVGAIIFTLYPVELVLCAIIFSGYSYWEIRHEQDKSNRSENWKAYHSRKSESRKIIQ